MEIKFTVDAEALTTALNVVSIVTPQSINNQAGYLFSVGGQECRVYSKNLGFEARSSFPIEDVTGEGTFIYPADYISAFSLVKGKVTFTATAEGDVFRVKYSFGSSGGTERASFDSRIMQSFEKNIQAAQEGQPKEFPIKVLQAAIAQAKTFLSKPNDTLEEVYRTIKVFGDEDQELAKKANGYMFASNSKEACYFYCQAFLGKDFSLHGNQLPLLESMLSRSSGEIKIYSAANMTYAVNSKQDVLGWSRHEAVHKRFSYYAKTDQITVRASCRTLLHQLNFMKAELPKGKSKIRMLVEPTNNTIRFTATDEKDTTTSLPVEVTPVDVKVNEAQAINVNVHSMIHLFESSKSDLIEFRIMIIPQGGDRPKPVFMFRTIDEFMMNPEGTVFGVSSDEDKTPEGAYLCRVTRFTTGID